MKTRKIIRFAIIYIFITLALSFVSIIPSSWLFYLLLPFLIPLFIFIVYIVIIFIIVLIANFINNLKNE